MSLLTGIETRVLNVGTLISSGLIRPMRPDHLIRFGRLYLAWGPTPALGYLVGAMTRGDETAVIDELGALTFAEMNRRTNALAHAWADDGINEGDRVAVMCRNHRGFIDATVALSKLGAHCLYLNTSFAGPQITDVVNREEVTGIVYDQEFGNLIADAAEGRRTYLAWQDPEGSRTTDAAADEASQDGERRPSSRGDGEVPDVDDSLEHLIRRGDPTDPVPPSEPGKTVILTSGTTGTPKGASRPGAAAGAGQDRHPAPGHARPAEGAPPPVADVARPGGGAAVEDSHQGRRGHDGRRAAVPRLGLRALRRRHGYGLDARAAAQVRPRADPRRHGRAPRHRARRGAGDAAAHPRGARGGARPLRPARAPGHCRQRLGPAGPAGDRDHGCVRRHRLQPLRVD